MNSVVKTKKRNIIIKKIVQRRRRRKDNILLHKDKDLSTSRLFTNLFLMTNTATLNTSNKNINNCGNLKYILEGEEEEEEVVTI